MLELCSGLQAKGLIYQDRAGQEEMVYGAWEPSQPASLTLVPDILGGEEGLNEATNSAYLGGSQNFTFPP